MQKLANAEYPAINYNSFNMAVSGLKIIRSFPLASLSTFRIGGLADFYVEIEEKSGLTHAIGWAKRNALPFFILAGGSNILFSDKGFAGLVIRMRNEQCVLDRGSIECQSGASLAKVVNLAKTAGLSGMEWAYGIPGTVGGAIRGNAGAFGGSMKDTVVRVLAFDSSSGRFMTLDKGQCRFSYRESLFKRKANLVIWSAGLELKKDRITAIADRMGDFAARRSKIQPSEPSAGSIFKNLLLADLEKDNPELAKLAQSQKMARKGKVGAGWVIDQLGLKGKSIGGAKVSEVHANFIVNSGKATADDVAMLISYVKQQVRDNFNVQLREEISYIGFN